MRSERAAKVDTGVLDGPSLGLEKEDET